ncbi:SigE family RNA polymerase sigma factor [Longispora sp. K20-0274]|uniref:SigE family RNA polymerase sigma factor n=1 Tax=Longispora sp. K20-0274 TaxID=3088255 RepID=UPI00399A9F19
MVTLQDDVGVGAVPDVGTSFDDFYAAHFQGLTIQLFAYTNDLGHAQDVVQEAFCRALSRWSRISGYDEPAAWVRRVAMNLATNRFRRARVALGFLRKQREEHIEGPSPDRVAIAAALATLPASHRRAVILHHLADLPIAEIAHQEGVAEGTVKSWLHRGRAALATQLKEKRDV